MKTQNFTIGCPIISGIELGKKNLSLLNFIKSNMKLSRKELVQKVINHPEFIYKSYQKSRSWDLIQKAKKANVQKAYEVRDTNGGFMNGIWICYFDFTMVYFR